MIRGITFDCWGTLMDAKYTYAAQRIAYLGERLPGLPYDDITRAYRHGESQIAQIEDWGMGWSTTSVLSLTLDALGVSLSPRDFADTVRYWEEAVLDDPPPLLEGIPEVLEILRSRGLSLGVICDTGLSPGHVLRRVLAQRDILHYFEHCTFSNETGVNKRRPLAFLLTLKALRFRPARLCMWAIRQIPIFVAPIRRACAQCFFFKTRNKARVSPWPIWCWSEFVICQNAFRSGEQPSPCCNPAHCIGENSKHSTSQ
ncbi:MAG: hypothetical protein A2Y73_05100 [Chloroflexi bacterium RBG_13_56_8]|nr:MAG: hypothetical protein A2Y73_05100 [Chloroflexi bacterium RBG_13_56_8]